MCAECEGSENVVKYYLFASPRHATTVAMTHPCRRCCPTEGQPILTWQGHNLRRSSDPE